MEIYTKVHSSKSVADVHKRKIEARGGKGAITKFDNGSYHIDYCFPEPPPDKPSKKWKYDILSPNGIPIRMRDKGLFKTIEEAITYFGWWKQTMEFQGYYFYDFQRIPLEYLGSACTFMAI